MKVFAIGDDRECQKCSRREDGSWFGSARWANGPRRFVCSNCGNDSYEWELEVPEGVSVPDVSRTLTDAEYRRCGWGYEDDDTCFTCGLRAYGGQFPLCTECGNCMDCVGEYAGYVCFECGKEVTCEP